MSVEQAFINILYGAAIIILFLLHGGANEKE